MAKVTCCANMCLQNKILFDECVSFTIGCLKMVNGLSKPDQRDFIRQKIQECVVTTSEQGYFKYSWTVGNYPGEIIKGCCRNLFMACYDIKKDYLER